MNIEKLNAMMENEAEVAKLADCESLEAVYERLNKNGVDCTMEDASNLVRAWRNNLADDAPMSLDDLDGVAGGSMFVNIVKQASPFKPGSSDDDKKPFGF